MNHSKLIRDSRQFGAFLSLSGANPVIRLLRTDSRVETFEGVREVLKVINPRSGIQKRKKDFIEGILEDGRSSFEASTVIIKNGKGKTEITDVIGIEVVSGGIERISDSTPKG